MNNRQALTPIVVTNASIGGAQFTISNVPGFAIQAVWPAGLVGTLDVQVTVDGINWSDVTNSSQVVNGAGSFIWNLNGYHTDQARLFFTYTSGSGTITASQSSKGPA